MTDPAIDRQYADLLDSLAQHFENDGRLAVIKAPPGSGKTHLLIETLARLVETSGLRMAVAAQTNAQADDIVRRLALQHPHIPAARFASKGHGIPDSHPGSVGWISNADHLPLGSSITTATSAKWALSSLPLPFDLLAVDEAWQMAWADLMQCATISARFLLIGDPGQIPPVVTIDVRRWETSPRAPHEAAPNVVLHDPDLSAEAFSGSLPACRRLPHESVDYVRPFYDFGFQAYVDPSERGLDLAPNHPLAPLANGEPVAITLRTPAAGPPLEVDHDIANLAANTARNLLAAGAEVRDGHGASRALSARDIGFCSSHRAMNAAIAQALGPDLPGARVDTPERWQGLERPVMIVVHPLSGVTDPSAFDLETGRLCVMASRHQAALIVVTRDHLSTTLANIVPSAEQAPGRPDVVGRGHDAHLRFWTKLEQAGRVFVG